MAEMLTIAKDSELSQAATDPAAELFPVLRRSHAMLPLVVAVAFVLPLLPLAHQTLSDHDALWGLRYLSLLSVEPIDGVSDTAISDPGAAIEFYPPLVGWLTASAMAVLGPDNIASLHLVAYLGTAIELIGVALLTSQWFGPRYAFWVVALLIGRSAFLKQAADPTANSVGMCLVVFVIWCYWKHLERPRDWVSWPLLGAGILLGFCLLAAGPLAGVVVLILLLHAAVCGWRPSKGIRTRSEARLASRSVLHALAAVAIMSLTAIAVGGWWILMHAYQEGGDFWRVWLTGYLPASGGQPLPTASGTLIASVGASQAAAVQSDFPIKLGVIGVLAIYGLWCAFRDTVWPKRGENSAKIDHFRDGAILLVWGLTAGIVWIVGKLGLDQSLYAGIWLQFMLIPGICLAARTLDEMTLRSIGLVSTLFLVVLAASVSIWSFRTSFGLAIGLLLLGTLSAAIAGLRLSQQSEVVRRSVLTTILLLIVGTNVLWGLADVTSGSTEPSEAMRFRRQIHVVDSAKSCTLVADLSPPTRLIYVLRSTWPMAKLRVLKRDEAVLAGVTLDPQAAFDGEHVIVEWNPGEFLLRNLQAQGIALEPIGSPQFLDGHELRAYRMVPARRHRMGFQSAVQHRSLAAAE